MNPLVPKEVFEICANAICNEAYKIRVLGIADQVTEAASEYPAAAAPARVSRPPFPGGYPAAVGGGERGLGISHGQTMR